MVILKALVLSIKKASPMVGFPLLLIPLAIYNIIVFLMPGVSLAEPIVKLPLMSSAEWPLALNDMLCFSGLGKLRARPTWFRKRRARGSSNPNAFHSPWHLCS